MTETKKPKFVFECQRTGNCCELRGNIEVFIEDLTRWGEQSSFEKIVSELDITYLPNGMPLSLIIKKKEIHGKIVCPFLEDKNCSIYGTRPISCVGYPLGYNGENYILLDKECPGINKGTMKKELLSDMRDAAKRSYESRRQTISVLPFIQAVVVKKMVEESEKMMEKLSKEEKEDIDKMLHKSDKKKEPTKKPSKEVKKKTKKSTKKKPSKGKKKGKNKK